MGLTVAEAFMLVAFILMMLLLWHIAIKEETKVSKEQISEDTIDTLIKFPDIERLVPDVGNLNEGHRRELGDLIRGRYLGRTIELLKKLKGLSEADLNLLRRGAKPVDPQRLMDLEAAKKDAERIKETGVPIKKIENLADMLQKHTVEKIKKALKIVEKGTGLSNRIEELLSEEDRARQDFVNELKRDLGIEIQDAGGRIDEFDGTITFPENALFAVGRDDIRPRFVDTLNKVCPIWLEKLRKSATRREIEEIMIEGHSSSEWSNASTERDAWILNLKLSQRRAQTVLEHCLRLVEGTPSGNWSRAKLAAIGYSSSRPVLEDGRESLRKSRRAVFGMRLSREQLRKEILKELQKEEHGDNP